MSKQREAFECFLENVHTNDLWVVWQQAWQESQADKMEFARKVAQATRTAIKESAHSEYNNYACEDWVVFDEVNLNAIIAKVEQEQ